MGKDPDSEKHIRNLADESLYDILQNKANDYSEEALRIVRNEIDRRGGTQKMNESVITCTKIRKLSDESLLHHLNNDAENSTNVFLDVVKDEIDKRGGIEKLSQKVQFSTKVKGMSDESLLNFIENESHNYSKDILLVATTEANKRGGLSGLKRKFEEIVIEQIEVDNREERKRHIDKGAPLNVGASYQDTPGHTHILGVILSVLGIILLFLHKDIAMAIVGESKAISEALFGGGNSYQVTKITVILLSFVMLVVGILLIIKYFRTSRR